VDRIACVNLPEFPLQLLLRQHPEWHAYPTAVVDRDKAQGVILWVNERARRVRILPGMRYAAGLSLSTQLRAGEVPQSDVDECVATITERLRFYTADVEPSPDEPGIFWLNGSGLRLLYPSLAKWAGLIHSDLQGDGYLASVAVGFSRFGTYAVARTTPGVSAFDDPDSERDASARVAIDRLGFDPALRDALFKLGITTVGGFLDLPANGIKKRFGAGVFRLYELARGDLFAPLQPQPPQDPIVVSVHLDYPEADLDRLMALVEKHLQSLFIQLTERCELLAAVSVRLDFDNRGRAAERLQPATPTLDVAQIAGLVRLRLGSLSSLTSGVVDLEIEIEGTPAQRRQGELFVEKSPRDLQAAARAFARLRAELGEGAVVCAVAREGHLPEATFEWTPMHEQPQPKARPVRLPPLVRRIYAKPVMFSPGKQRDAGMQLTAHIDDGSIHETQGPYIVSGGWWQREVQREYYFVRTANGRSLWMYYDRRRVCWFIHGEVE